MPEQNKNKDFSGFLNKILFSETEAVASESKTEKPDKKQYMPEIDKIASVPDQDASAAEIDKNLVNKIHDFLKTIDAPGIDFFEIWNVANAMDGGINEANIKSAYTTLKVISQNQLSLSHIESTGLNYKQEIENLIKKDIEKKGEEKNRILQELALKKSELEDKINNLKNQIQTLNSQLDLSERQFKHLSGQYDPKLQDIDRKINAGSKASNLVIQEIDTLLDLIKKTIKE